MQNIRAKIKKIARVRFGPCAPRRKKTKKKIEMILKGDVDGKPFNVNKYNNIGWIQIAAPFPLDTLLFLIGLCFGNLTFPDISYNQILSTLGKIPKLNIYVTAGIDPSARLDNSEDIYFLKLMFLFVTRTYLLFTYYV